MSASAVAGRVDVVKGKLLELSGEQVVVGLPGSDYRLHLVPQGKIEAVVNKPIQGRIRARARRVDATFDGRGGRYIEPVYGRPRRVQGRIVAHDTAANTITVDAACPVICTLVADQKAADFPPGTFVTFDVERGATFEMTA
jgi:hypothetical protein